MSSTKIPTNLKDSKPMPIVAISHPLLHYPINSTIAQVLISVGQLGTNTPSHQWIMI